MNNEINYLHSSTTEIILKCYFDFHSIFESIIEHDGRADFNNDGSSGEIEINLKTRRVKINVSRHQGEETYLIGEVGEVGEDADLV